MWIMCEGLDRSGKSTLAKYYEDKGFTVVHMKAPDSKYFKDDYSGESYLEEMVRLYSKYDGNDVFWDRTPMGELIWPNIYGRLPLLNEEDLEYLSMIERNNQADKILMFDSDSKAHWQRCVDNKEPLTELQFGRASVFYERLSNEYGFTKKELPDFPEISMSGAAGSDSSGEEDIPGDVANTHSDAGNNDTSGTSNGDSKVGTADATEICDESSASSVLGDSSNTIEQKLTRANAIRSLLSGAIVKKKGEVYADLDEAIRGFLQQELDSIFTKRLESEIFSNVEINILKSLAQRVQEKAR